jgi:hypothetical protein
MPDTAKVVINLATGLEDAKRATAAFLVGGEAVERAPHLRRRPQAGPGVNSSRTRSSSARHPLGVDR